MDRYAKKRAMLVTKYWRWHWHFRIDGTMWMQDPKTRRVIDVGRVE